VCYVGIPALTVGQVTLVVLDPDVTTRHVNHHRINDGCIPPDSALCLSPQCLGGSVSI